MPEIDATGTVTTFLTFEGAAEEAIEFYVSLFDDAEIGELARYGPGDVGAEGTVSQAAFSLAGTTFMATDSAEEHAFGFTPAMSLFVDCGSDAEVDRLFEALAADGEVLMPLDAYPFAARFGWVQDRFGVSWQLRRA